MITEENSFNLTPTFLLEPSTLNHQPMPLPYKLLNLVTLTAILLVTPHPPTANQRLFSPPLATAQTVEERKQEADRLLDLGVEQYQRSQYRDALQSYERALEIYRAIGDTAGEGSALNNLGNVYESLGEYAQAEQYYLQSLEIARQLGDKAGEGISLYNLGNVYESLGEYAQAEQYYLQSLEIYRQLGYKAGEGSTLMNLGNVYRNLGEYAQAEQFLLQSLEIARQLGDKAGEGDTLNNLGNIYQSLGEYAQAEQYYLQSLEIYRQLGDKAEEGMSLNNLGVVYESLGEYAQAEQFLLQSLEIFRQLGDKAGEGNALHNLGNVYQSLGEYAQAEQFLLQSLEIDRQLGDKSGEGISLNNLGNVYESLGEYAQAEQFLLQSLEIFRQIGDKAGEGMSLHNLGLVYQKRGEYAQAEQSYLASIEVKEQLRPGLTDAQKISLFEQQKTTYELLQAVLVAQNKTDRALEISERGRARAFVELLAQRLADTPDNALTVTPANLTQIKQIAAAQNATLVQYSYIREGLQFNKVDLVEESELYIWVIKPTGEISFRRSNLNPVWQEQESSLGEAIANARCFENFICRRNITVAETRGGTTEVHSDRGSAFSRETAPQNTRSISPRQQREWQQLYQLLIEPIADLLPTNPNDKVIFVPHASLFLVPFPALLDANGTYLLEKHTILTAPSIQVLDFTQKQQPQGDILIVGNPTMPSVGQPPQQLSPLLGAEKEAQDIGNLLQVTPLIGSQATESAVVQKMQSSRIIHLATHGSFDPTSGIDSWIALTPTSSDDGLLTAGEIFDLELNADLVVLSACDTGRGEITGDGVIGLSRSLMSAGTASVLVSLWKVPDDATYLLMREFYQNWESSGNKAQALRQAMLTTMQQYPNPENWAAFTLMGEAQ
jgi:CHAT domain-containing protein